MYCTHCYHRAGKVVAAGRRSSAAAPGAGTAEVAGRRGMGSTDQCICQSEMKGKRRTMSLPAVVLVHAVPRGVVRLPGWRRSAVVALPEVLMSFLLHGVWRGCGGVQILLLLEGVLI